MSSENRFKAVVAVLIAIVTSLGAVLAYMQSEAGSLDDRANRDSKLYSLEAIGFKIAGDSRINFEFNRVYQTWDELDTLAMTSREDDPELADLYEKVRDEIGRFSPLFDSKKGYFDKKDDAPDFLRFEAETYHRDMAVLDQKYKAAAFVKDNWDRKANTYILHLTLLSVALFLYGLSLTVNARFTRTLFVVVASGLSIIVTFWAWRVWAEPVPDLRDFPKAIEAFANGEALSHRDKYNEAVAEYSKALTDAPDFYDALVSRGFAYYKLDKNAESAADLEKALAINDQPNVAVSLSDAYFDSGRFAESANVCRTALEKSPDNLDLRFNLAISLLAMGQVDAAKAEYKAGMDRATELVVAAHQKNEEPPGELWEALDVASKSLDSIAMTAAGEDQGPPPRDKIVGADKLPAICEELTAKLDSLSTSLEYMGKAPEGTLAAKWSEMEFGEPVYKNGDLDGVSPAEGAEFESGTSKVALKCDYTGMKDGQEVVLKVYKGADEQPSWRIVEKWTLGESGEVIYALTPGYAETFAFPADDYTVQIFVDGQQVARGGFTVKQ